MSRVLTIGIFSWILIALTFGRDFLYSSFYVYFLLEIACTVVFMPENNHTSPVILSQCDQELDWIWILLLLYSHLPSTTGFTFYQYCLEFGVRFGVPESFSSQFSVSYLLFRRVICMFCPHPLVETADACHFVIDWFLLIAGLCSFIVMYVLVYWFWESSCPQTIPALSDFSVIVMYSPTNYDIVLVQSALTKIP